MVYPARKVLSPERSQKTGTYQGKDQHLRRRALPLRLASQHRVQDCQYRGKGAQQPLQSRGWSSIPGKWHRLERNRISAEYWCGEVLILTFQTEELQRQLG